MYLFQGNSQRAWDVWSSLPGCCPLLAQDISDPALALSLLVLCSVAVKVTVLEMAFPGLYQPGFTACNNTHSCLEHWLQS